MKTTIYKYLFHYLKFILPLFLFVLAVIEITPFMSSINPELLRNEVNQFNIGKLVLVLLISMGAVSPMFLYDSLLLKSLQKTFPKKQLLKQSFIVNAFSNLIGSGGIISGMLRKYFYQTYEVDKQKLSKTIGNISYFYLTGLSLLALMILFAYRDSLLLEKFLWLFVVVIAVGLYLPMLIFQFVRHHDKSSRRFFGSRTKFQLIAVSFLEWTFAFLAVWLLANILELNISFHELFPIFVVASCVGIVSMIPGGLGSFDLIFIWGTQLVGVQDEKVFFLLILYRVGYFFFPFLLAAILFVRDYWEKWNANWDSLPLALIQRLSHVMLTLLVFISGLILLLSAALPGIIDRLKILEEMHSLPFLVNLSHQLSVGAGFALLGLSRGIEYKVKRAYYLTIVVLFAAAAFTFSKGIDYEEAIFLLLVAFILYMSRTRFYRESYVLTWSKTIIDGLVILFITSMYVLIGYLSLPSSNGVIPPQVLPYVITDYHTLFYSALIGLMIALIVFVIGTAVIKPRNPIKESSPENDNEIQEHLVTYGGNTLAHLIFLHDKSIFWNSKKTVLICFQKSSDKLVVLGDPIGQKEAFPEAIEEFQHLADIQGYTPVFYEVSNSLLPILHEKGFGFFKLGEEAFVDLDQFTLSGKRMKALRAVKNKFERENFQVEIVKPPHSEELLQKLKNVSDEWLQGRNEKGFSLGFYHVDYLNKSEIAIMKEHDRIIAFTSLMPVYDNNKTVSVDLMRFLHDAPSGTMDVMFLSLFEWAKTEGYERFNLGMAPLSNVGQSKFSFLSERIAAQIFLHGHIFYHFQGLRKFKGKYAHTWERKYLAYRKKSSLPFTMAQVSLLIGRQRK
ncbi:bifunctional lysylphosphatidylglycerol flippase/synthetase MprF [Alkalihalobacillus hwajinpoensis]|uniref:bifunctional lysylphosphatidylglycerol flippase/synthetase MprF n=1 Tax=Guptibacillus hwajinpoensis TaxID=208199 RepID=UPI00188401B6|nr:bifunctional lysylphosphatidylglycerol flippase/synthetase MprF [Pseudalkalibacillus hwajinpoensis]MBF0707880.1 bifunctional lysylphosphatidylglycerol flippase/synthetase MprF [Pseudalkalibacillus hwajinpoensis]